MSTTASSTTRRAVASAVAVGLLGGAVLTGRPSAAYLVVGVLAVAAARSVDRRSPWSVGWAILAVALLTVPAVRDSGWLAAASVALSVWCIALASGRSATFTGAVLAPLMPVVLQGSVARELRADAGTVRLPSGRSAMRTVRVVGSTLILVTVFTLLFAGADERFASLVDHVLPSVSVDVGLRGPAVAVLVTLWILGTAHARRSAVVLDDLAPGAGKRRSWWDWAMPVVALDVVFVAFVVVQAATLFGGHDHVMQADDLTFADHARSGFWQLVAVTVGVLGVVAVQARKVDAASHRDRMVARAAFGTLCVLSLVVVWSAIHRMSLYEQQFGLTRLRVTVMAVEVWLGVVIVAVMAVGVRWSARHLPAFVVAAANVGTLVSAAVDVDALVAERAVDRYRDTGLIDVDYVSTLSADAVPALSTLPPAVRGCVLPVPTDDPWWNANRARSEAAAIMAADPPSACARRVREAGR